MSNVVHWRTGRSLEDEKAHWKRVERGIEVYHAFEPVLKRLQKQNYDRHIIAEKTAAHSQKGRDRIPRGAVGAAKRIKTPAS